MWLASVGRLGLRVLGPGGGRMGVGGREAGRLIGPCLPTIMWFRRNLRLVRHPCAHVRPDMGRKPGGRETYVYSPCVRAFPTRSLTRSSAGGRPGAFLGGCPRRPGPFARRPVSRIAHRRQLPVETHPPPGPTEARRRELSVGGSADSRSPYGRDRQTSSGREAPSYGSATCGPRLVPPLR